METIESRVLKLERSNRVWRSLALAMLAFGVGVAAKPGDGAQDVVRTKRLEIVNDAGKPVVLLYAVEEGGTILVSNNSGSPLAMLSTGPDGGSILVSNNSGKPVAMLSTGQNGGSVLVANALGKTLATLP